MRMQRLTPIALVCTAALAFPSQGDGADSDCANADAQPSDVSVTDYASSLLCVVNATRRDWGRPPLDAQRNLRRAAAWQASDMTQKDYFSHTSADGDTLADRLDQANFISALRSLGRRREPRSRRGPGGISRGDRRWLDEQPRSPCELARPG